ncbi:MAG: glycosyl hydrolase [Patescibacteria group bacterium]|nr:glycosyl hydrolase [Patescibacteria group bacterium]
MKLKVLGLIVLAVSLAISLDLSSKVTQFFSKATEKMAAIVVEADKEIGPMPRLWNNFSQGGESSEGMLTPAIKQMQALSPSYIRIDHIYDFYETVTKENGRLKFNWTKLDREVEAILKMGAKPFLALSYMPPALSSEVTGKPDSWDQWQELVKATIEHYSGKNNKNIDKVYYEVWNEPDLFGGWKTSGDKNYLDLYRQSALAANKANNVLAFKLGGPGTTGMYRNWIEAMLKMVNEENLRFDFVSWHRYSLEPEQFKKDVEELSRLLAMYPRLALKEKVVSEWGLDAENNPGYDNNLGAAHTVASVMEMIGSVSKALSFEIKDGLINRFGIISHEDTGLILKPRYQAFKWLNDIKETRLYLSGEGSFVKGVAAKKDKEIQINLVNYDQAGRHRETVSVIIKNILPGDYEMVQENFDGGSKNTLVKINNGTWTGQVMMPINAMIRLTLKPVQLINE